MVVEWHILVYICSKLLKEIYLAHQMLNAPVAGKSHKIFATQPVHLWLFFIVPSTIINQ